ncbi:MAG: hypothetical protein L6Q66_11510 [Bacteroidia bacterium]|nr:hypothetical protein [Bacteroidia bacterium]
MKVQSIKYKELRRCISTIKDEVLDSAVKKINEVQNMTFKLQQTIKNN